MVVKKTVYSAEKANAVFAVKLRKLFDESGKTHVSLAKHIDEVSGESITRQAVGQWCSGNTCPSLKIVPIIADFFGVTTDYLLTDTEIKTADTDIKGICEYTGLTEKAVTAFDVAIIKDPQILKTVNFLLEDLAELKKFRPHKNMRTYIKPLICAINNYFVSNFQDRNVYKNKFFLVNENGVIVEDTPDEDAGEVEISTIPVEDVLKMVEEWRLRAVTDALKEKWELYQKYKYNYKQTKKEPSINPTKNNRQEA